MPAPNTPFLLPEIITGINSPASVKELLDLYAGPLTAENENNSIPVVVPVSGIRMQNIVESYRALEAELQTTFQLWEELIKWSGKITTLVESINNLAEATNPDTELLMLARKGKVNTESSNSALKSVFLALNEHEFNVMHLAWDGYLLTHKRLDDLVQRNEYEPAFVIKELKTISEDLQAYQQSISWTTLRSGIPAVLQTFISLNTVSAHKSSLHDFINHVQKRKELNPLITDAMVEDVDTLEKLLNTILALFNAAINSIYWSEVRQEGMIDAIGIYQMILNRLFSASNT